VGSSVALVVVDASLPVAVVAAIASTFKVAVIVDALSFEVAIIAGGGALVNIIAVAPRTDESVNAAALI
jgi:hypothetical protein